MALHRSDASEVRASVGVQVNSTIATRIKDAIDRGSWYVVLTQEDECWGWRWLRVYSEGSIVTYPIALLRLGAVGVLTLGIDLRNATSQTTGRADYVDSILADSGNTE